MWVYNQKTGALSHNGVFVDRGYSGNGNGKNSPAMEGVKKTGPLPRGVYRIGDPYDSKRVGPYALPLMPDVANEMYGRDAFRIHGDSKTDPGTASDGCIILPRPTREKVVASLDRELVVISGEGEDRA